MRLSPSPDLSSNRRLVLTALAVAALSAAIQASLQVDLRTSLLDTDDAMRLFLVRGLLHGQGWWDQLVTRLAPPHGVYMHWSRLLDGGIAGLDWLLSRLMPPATAEWVTRFVWPLLWIPVAVAGALVVARRFGTRSAVFVAAPLMVSLLPLYRQFPPGRIDHHNVQITMAVLALAGAVSVFRSSPQPAEDERDGTRGDVAPAIVAGAAGGLGLAIGLEALAFHALVGAAFALRLMLDRRAKRPVAAYGLALALSTLGFYSLQTPPWRWGLSFCDAIGLNLVAALALAGFGLAAVAALAGRIGGRARVGLTVTVGLATRKKARRRCRSCRAACAGWR